MLLLIDDRLAKEEGRGINPSRGGKKQCYTMTRFDYGQASFQSS
jgi:hypothetical protein